MLALLSAALPLATTLTSTLLAVNNEDKSIDILKHPTLPQIQAASSVHVFAFTADGDLLVAESEGEFDMDDWDKVCEEAKRVCCGTGKRTDTDMMMDGSEGNGGMAQFLRDTMQEKARADVHWKK